MPHPVFILYHCVSSFIYLHHCYGKLSKHQSIIQVAFIIEKYLYLRFVHMYFSPLIMVQDTHVDGAYLCFIHIYMLKSFRCTQPLRIFFYLYLCCIHKNILSGQLTNKAFSLCCVANPCLHSLIIWYYISVVFFSALCLFTSIICSLSLFAKSTSKLILIYIFLFL